MPDLIVRVVVAVRPTVVVVVLVIVIVIGVTVAVGMARAVCVNVLVKVIVRGILLYAHTSIAIIATAAFFSRRTNTARWGCRV